MPQRNEGREVFKASDWCFPEWSDLTGGSGGGGLIYGGFLSADLLHGP